MDGPWYSCVSNQYGTYSVIFHETFRDAQDAQDAADRLRAAGFKTAFVSSHPPAGGDLRGGGEAMARVGVVCRGAWILGNNCGECRHCLTTAREGVIRIRQLNDEVARMREALRLIASRWDDGTLDLRAACADGLGVRVDQLEG